MKLTQYSELRILAILRQAEFVIRSLSRIIESRGKPKKLFIGNYP